MRPGKEIITVIGYLKKNKKKKKMLHLPIITQSCILVSYEFWEFQTRGQGPGTGVGGGGGRACLKIFELYSMLSLYKHNIIL